MAAEVQPFELTEENFQEIALQSDLPVLVDFWAEWCGPCRQLEPVMEELAQRFDGRALVAAVNVDEQPRLAAEYEIRSIPTLLFLEDGSVTDRVRGLIPKHEIADRLSGRIAA